jgi:hypothetical protein
MVRFQTQFNQSQQLECRIAGQQITVQPGLPFILETYVGLDGFGDAENWEEAASRGRSRSRDAAKLCSVVCWRRP